MGTWTFFQILAWVVICLITQFLMDFLKFDAPFWKQELTASGQAIWVEQKESDRKRRQQW